MKPVEIRPDVYWVGVNDREKDLFEGLWPIKDEGVSYNSYLIKDEKNALIDLASEGSEAAYLAQLSSLIDPAKIDYVIINHMEPDHSGLLLKIIELAPQVKLLGTEKVGGMLEAFYGISDNFQSVQHNETLSLGKHTLHFTQAPMVHWPETMLTYETSQKILFSCDAFGSYGALEGSIFDDESDNLDFYTTEALRYYSNIIASYSKPVLNAINKLAGVDVEVVAPSHGLVWRKDPGKIISLYKTWAGYAASGGEAGVTVLYGSMYGNTLRMLESFEKGLQSSGLTIKRFDVARTHASTMLPSIWSLRGVVVAAPTYDGGIFPAMADILTLAGKKRMMNKKCIRFGSYTWGGGADKAFNALNESLKWELVEAIDFMGSPDSDTLKKAEALGSSFGEQLT